MRSYLLHAINTDAGLRRMSGLRSKPPLGYGTPDAPEGLGSIRSSDRLIGTWTENDNGRRCLGPERDEDTHVDEYIGGPLLDQAEGLGEVSADDLQGCHGYGCRFSR